eukprot:TRINITY_DN49134_c0_g1_i1.p1 TRINITY_DN49134_c0_g1~~TRINITY_DN49134_c0_g1_i1.p1  ORF type:complete len:128 (+),score=17.24 TRINITY_DN49134_c0_g1_i1:67-450(+)
MALTVNPDCTLWKEVTNKEARAFAFKNLQLRRAQSSPSLSNAGSLTVDKRKFLPWRSSITALPAAPPAEEVSRGHLSTLRCAEQLASIGMSDTRPVLYGTLRSSSFYANWAGRPQPPGGVDFKQSRR